MLNINKNKISDYSNIFCLDTYVIRDKNCIGYCCSEHMALYDKISIAIESGYQAVELWHKDVLNFYKKEHSLSKITNLIKDNNIFVASYKVVEDWFEKTCDIGKVEEILDIASKINSKSIVVKLLSDSKEHEDQPVGYFIDRYSKLLEICKPYKIDPSIEFMVLANRMNSIENVYEVLEKTGGKLVVDTWHLWRKDNKNFDRFEKTINRLKPEWISVIHFTDASKEISQSGQKDGDRKLPNLGCLNLSKFCKLMNDINFKGIYSLNVYDRSLWDEDPLAVASKGLYLMKSCFINEKLADSESWRLKQKKRCEGLWSKQYYTHLDPRIKISDREDKIENILRPYLEDRVVLDFKCGFSPLAKYVKYGFDAFEECIRYLKDKFPEAEWTCCSDEYFSKNFNKKIDVLLHIGLGDSITEVESHLLIRNKCNPKIVIIECAANSKGEVDESKPGNLGRWNILAKDLLNTKSFFYKTNMAERENRLILVGEV